MSKRISQLTVATTIGSTDLLPIVQGGTSKQAAMSLIALAHTHAGTYASLGSDQGQVVSRLFEGSWRDNRGTMADLPGTTISAVTKLYTVPTGYLGFISAGGCNTTGSAINLSMFAMTDGSTPVAADRIAFQSMGATVGTGVTLEVVLPAGGTIWAFAATTPGLNLALDVLLIPVANQYGTFTAALNKNLPTSDTLLYTVSQAGHQAVEFINGNVHNTTSSAITLNTKLKRSTDGSAITIWTQSIGANSQNGFVNAASHLRTTLLNGDSLYVAASATGLNLATCFCDRAVAGAP